MRFKEFLNEAITPPTREQALAAFEAMKQFMFKKDFKSNVITDVQLNEHTSRIWWNSKGYYIFGDVEMKFMDKDNGENFESYCPMRWDGSVAKMLSNQQMTSALGNHNVLGDMTDDDALLQRIYKKSGRWVEIE
jgi:hypothetical protein